MSDLRQIEQSNQNKDSNLLQQTEARRLDLLAEIGKKRNSTVIAYLTTTRPGAEASVEMDDMFVIEPHVRAARDQGARNIDLILMTYGGSGVTPWDVVSMIREYFKVGRFRVFVPSVAYSAGSLLSLGADEIVMGPASVLGPVDGQFRWPSGGVWRHASTADFKAFLDFTAKQGLGGLFTRKRIPGLFVSQMDAPAIGALYRMWREDQRVTMKLLASRRPPLSQRRNDQIAKFMLTGVGEHGQSIRRSEARAAGISFITDIEKSGVEQEVTKLFALYSDVLKLAIPHAVPTANLAKAVGDEHDFDAYGRHISETPIAVVESLHETNPAYIVYGLRHWNQVPPVPPVPAPVEEETEVALSHKLPWPQSNVKQPPAPRTVWYSARSKVE